MLSVSSKGSEKEKKNKKESVLDEENMRKK